MWNTTHILGNNVAIDNSLWSDEELKDSVLAYKAMQNDIAAGKPVVKRAIYRQLAKKWGRSENSYERRMSNISAILDLLGKDWIKGLEPLVNVGPTNTPIIIKYLKEVDDVTNFGDIAFELEVIDKVKKGTMQMPIGNSKPLSKKIESTSIIRDPNVKAWVLINAKGICENCGGKAPFETSSGIPYLEVHHVKKLADLGPDTPENAIAVCPNCHRSLHYSHEKSELVGALYTKIKRLKI
jgi:5-methylcytosine-specific restriction protein A